MDTIELTQWFYYYQGQQDVTDNERMKTALTIDWLLDQDIDEQDIYKTLQDYPIGTVCVTYDNLPDSLWDCGTMLIKLRKNNETVNYPLNLIERNQMYCHNALRTYPKVLPYNMKTFMEPKLRFILNDLLEYIIATLELDRKYIDIDVTQWQGSLLNSVRQAKKYESLGMQSLDVVMYTIDCMQDYNDLSLYNTQGFIKFKPEYLRYAEEKVKQRQMSHTDEPVWRTQIWHG